MSANRSGIRQRGRRLALDVRLLAQARFSLGMTILEVAKAAEVSESTGLRAFRTGLVSLRSARKIARVLSLRLEGLWVENRTGLPWPSEEERG